MLELEEDPTLLELEDDPTLLELDQTLLEDNSDAVAGSGLDVAGRQCSC